MTSKPSLYSDLEKGPQEMLRRYRVRRPDVVVKAWDEFCAMPKREQTELLFYMISSASAYLMMMLADHGYFDDDDDDGDPTQTGGHA